MCDVVVVAVLHFRVVVGCVVIRFNIFAIVIMMTITPQYSKGVRKKERNEIVRGAGRRFGFSFVFDVCVFVC